MKHDRSVDLTRPGLPIDLRIVQGDARTHSITYTLYEGSMRWIIPDGTTAVIHYAKGDGTGGEYDKLPDGTEAIELNNNECTITLAEQVLTWAGCVRLQVTLSNQNGQQLSFWETIIKVLPNVAGYVVKSEDYISVTPSAIASELNDLRVDYTGKRHSKAGDAVREVDKSLAEQIDKLNEGGLNIKDDVIAADVSNWLDEHPEATTTVQDGSLSYKSFIFGELPYVTPEFFGATGDGKTDDTEAIKRALTCELPSNGYILFSPKTYCVSSVLNVANKNIIFNNCTLKRIADCTVVNFTRAKNFILSNLNIEDDGKSYGNMLVGHGCENVTIQNVSIQSTSPHTDTSGGNWATSLSGERFHIKGIYIKNNESGLWADGLHFGYITNSLIEDFVIFSGDDSIAITQQEGNTDFLNATSENVRFLNGAINSSKASAFRLGFDNAKKRSTDEISACYHKNILFENIKCNSAYFIRDEYISNDSNAIPPSDEKIMFFNVDFSPKRDVTTFPFFFVSKEFQLKDWRFKECKIFCNSITISMKQPFFYTANADVKNESKLTFDSCDFDFSFIRGFLGGYINELIFLNCSIKTNGNIITAIHGGHVFKNCSIKNYGESSNYFCQFFNSEDGQSIVNRISDCIIDNFSQISNDLNDNNIKNYISDCIYTDNTAMNLYSGKTKYNNITKGKKRLSRTEDMFLYVPQSGSIKIDCTGYTYMVLRPIEPEIAAEDIVIRIYDNYIMSSSAKRAEIKSMLSTIGIATSYKDPTITISNSTSTYKNIFVKFYSQTN